MRTSLVTAFVFCLAFASTAMGVERSVEGRQSVEQHRPIDDVRVWSFFSVGNTFGTLISRVARAETVNGVPALVYKQDLEVNYSELRAGTDIARDREWFVGLDYTYLGDRIEITTGDNPAEEMELNRHGDSLVGYFTRGGEKIPRALEVDRETPVWDPNFVDQLELYLAMRDLSVGDSIVDTIFQPLSLVESRIVGHVEDFFFQEIYQGAFDSIFWIRLSEPMRADLMFTPDRRLVKVDLINQNIRIYQDIVRKENIPTAQTQAEPSGDSPIPTQPRTEFSLVKLLAMTPHYIVYLLLTVVALLFFIKTGYRWKESYLAYIIGGLFYLVILFTAAPLQQYIIREVILPGLRSGSGGVYGWSLLPALISGVIQGLLILGAIYAVIMLFKPKEYRYPVLGAVCGAGFALFEAAYQVGLSLIPLFSLNLVEKGFVILFHVAAGALLGQSLHDERRSLPVTLAIVIAFQTLLRYLPVFVQQGKVEVELMYLIYAFLCTGFLAYALLRVRPTPSLAK